MNYQLHIFDNAELTARAVAELIKEKSKIINSEKFNIAISGGKTPLLLYNLLAKNEYRQEINWDNLRFFWVDERCVEPADPESNYGMTYDALFRFTLNNHNNVFRMKGENVPEDEAEQYRNLLWNKLPVKNKFPVFDLILLGIGDDGHVASIFPDNLSLLQSELSVEVVKHPILKQKRITLTGKTICNANQVVFLVTGLNKSEIVKNIITHNSEAAKYPASYIHDNKDCADFYMDKSAASKL